MILFFVNVSAQNWEVDFTNSINPKKPTSDFWKVNSSSAYYISGAMPFVFLAEGFIKKDPVLKRKSYEMFGTLFIELVISESMKSAFKRNRPAEDYPGIIFPYKSNVSGRSFPSGHTSLAFATAAGVSIQCKKWYVTVPAYVWAASIGYSRMYLGVHYPSDILAGAVVGIGSAYLSNWLNKKIFPREKRSVHKSGE